MLFEYFDLKEEGALIRKAVDASLDANVRTPEIQVAGGGKYGTKEVGAWIVDYIKKAWWYKIYVGVSKSKIFIIISCHSDHTLMLKSEDSLDERSELTKWRIWKALLYSDPSFHSGWHIFLFKCLGV